MTTEQLYQAASDTPLKHYYTKDTQPSRKCPQPQSHSSGTELQGISGRNARNASPAKLSVKNIKAQIPMTEIKYLPPVEKTNQESNWISTDHYDLGARYSSY